ncbi:hypothetical protein [Novosphingobium cyanobacteriorum]|uniref:Uncharacterized protein n=1 Tax=Novosphingobium cyanobacteriorum TaxID=3024215 RepID=A0ABT6CMP5_9SPHN|nr:hypothetical protein [Novosphingobium cyanobacteriorum]MDF8335188.1 hypothetical protein [Novosphingobium cyanobacteriorum]
MKNRLKSKTTEIASPSQIRASYIRWGLVTVPGMTGMDFLLKQMYEGGLSGYWLQQSGIFGDSNLAFAAQVFRIGATALLGGALAILLASRGADRRGTAISAVLFSFFLSSASQALFFVMQAVGLAQILMGCALLGLAAGIRFAGRVRISAAVLLIPHFLSLIALTYAFGLAGQVYRPELPDGPHGITVKL